MIGIIIDLGLLYISKLAHVPIVSLDDRDCVSEESIIRCYA